MSSTSPSSPPKRPRLSLQIKAVANGTSGRTSRCLAAAVDVKSPTAFNTLSNVYATAVDRSTPVQEAPPTAILGRRPMLRLQTQEVVAKERGTHTPYLGPYLDTPITAQPISPAVANQIYFPSAAMTATPPLSAQPLEQNGAQVFTFDSTTPATAVPPSVRAQQHPKRRTTMPAGSTKLPYTHPRSLRSILRNSPLPPLSTKSPESPRRQSLRLQEKAARRVAYNSPLTQEITTSRYTRSHIDLLADDATPISPATSSSDDGDNSLDQAMADAASCDSTRDGGQTPGPFEEMRRRMANMQASTPVALSPTGGGIRKRGGKRREKKRRWVWTIGQDEDAEEGESAVAAAKKDAAAPAPAPAAVPVIAVPAPRPRTRNQQALAKAVAAATQAQVPVLAVPVPPARAPTTVTTAPATTSPAPAATTTTTPPVTTATKTNTTTHEPQPQPQPQPQSQPSPSPPRPHHHHHHQYQPQHARELTPIPSSLLPTRHSTPDSCASHSVRYLSPEPSSHLSMSMSMSMSDGMHFGSDPHNNMAENAEPPTPSVESTASNSSSYDSVFEEAAAGMRMGGTGGAGGIGAGGMGGGMMMDVEMSDASSVSMSEDEVDDGKGGYGHVTKAAGYYAGVAAPVSSWRYGGAGDGDVEMDEGTPTMTARPVSDRFGGEDGGGGGGWAPWRDGVAS